MSATVLYTPDVLALAVRLSHFPLRDEMPHVAEARSQACGSAITLGLATDADGRIEAVGLRSQACAIGQAAAAIFADGAQGKSRDDIAGSHAALTAWLAGDGALPDWPGLETIAAAQGYPGRHAALMLPWNAALRALP